MSEQWYCRIRGREQGPFSAQQLQSLAQQGLLAPNHLVRQGMDGSWVSASRIHGLFRGSIATPEAITEKETPPDRPNPVKSKTAPPVRSPRPPSDAQSSPVGVAATHGNPVGEADSEDAAPQPPEKNVLGGLILALGIGILGLCLYSYPILGALIGLATSIVCLRNLPKAIRGEMVSKATAIAATAVALVALTAGTLTTIKSKDPVAGLRQKLGIEGDESEIANRSTVNAAEKKASVDGVDVSILEARVGALKRATGSNEIPTVGHPDDKFLFLRVLLENEHGEDSVEYHSWSDSVRQQRNIPKLIDDIGNEYPAMSFGDFQLPGQISRSDLHRFEKLTDLLVFRKPQEGFAHLHLALSASALGGEGQIRFDIPKSMVVKFADSPQPDDRQTTDDKSIDSAKTHNPLETIEIKREPEDDQIKEEAAKPQPTPESNGVKSSE